MDIAVTHVPAFASEAAAGGISACSSRTARLPTAINSVDSDTPLRPIRDRYDSCKRPPP